MMPGNYPLNIYRGDTHAWKFILWADADKTEPVDLAGSTVKAEIRERTGGAVIHELELTVTLPNIIDAFLSGDDSSTLPNAARWDLQITDTALDWVSTILAGTVTIAGDITDSIAPAALATERRQQIFRA